MVKRKTLDCLLVINELVKTQKNSGKIITQKQITWCLILKHGQSHLSLTFRWFCCSVSCLPISCYRKRVCVLYPWLPKDLASRVTHHVAKFRESLVELHVDGDWWSAGTDFSALQLYLVMWNSWTLITHPLGLSLHCVTLISAFCGDVRIKPLIDLISEPIGRINVYLHK